MSARIFSIIFAVLLFVSNAIYASGIAYIKVKSCGTVAHVSYIDLNNPDIRVSVALAKGGRGSTESFKSIINRTKPSAAITGTFFCTKSYIPTGDIALFGTVVHKGSHGAALCVDSENKAQIISLSKGRKSNWEGYETVMCAGPALLSNGKISIALKHEGFRSSLYSSTRRTAVGVTNKGKLLLVAINRNVTLYKIARVMLKLGVRDALCLDGGSSTAFLCKGQIKAQPARRLTNLLVVYENPTDYYNEKYNLVPPKLMAKSEALKQVNIKMKMGLEKAKRYAVRNPIASITLTNSLQSISITR
jgi:hypothetical protein